MEEQTALPSLNLSLEDLEELKSCLQETIYELEDGTIFMTPERIQEIINKRKCILSMVESAIVHLSMDCMAEEDHSGQYAVGWDERE